MMVIKSKGQICRKCGSFHKRFMVCEACRRNMCVKCAMDDSFCIECYTLRKQSNILDEYFSDKYRDGVKI